MNAKVIVIEPSESAAQALAALLRFLDLEPLLVRDVAEFRGSLDGVSHEFLAVIVGSETIDGQGVELVACLRKMPLPLPLIYLSTQSLPKIAESSGDLAWFQLDFPVKQRRLSAVLAQAQKIRSGHPTQPGLHRFRPSGTSRPMRAVHRMIEQVAPHNTNVLILGESGTGKEMVARHIHELSDRAGRPFVPVNCGAIPADLLESELFGHEKGAFTGALSTRLGRFEFAEGGTLFLDEIGDMSLQMQVKLLRVLQERSFERVGSNRTIRCNVRIVAATHRNLEVAITEGRFREDLFYRLNVFPIQMPPLRERLEDLPVLIDHLAQRQEQIAGRRINLDKGAMNCLMRNPWPGNVRELANLLERLAILFPQQTVGSDDLPERYRSTGAADWVKSAVLFASPAPATQSELTHMTPVSHMEDSLELLGVAETIEMLEPGETGKAVEPTLPRGGIDLKDHLSCIEIGLIRQALQAGDGTVAGAARLLKMQRTTLVEKLRKYRMSA